MIKRISALFLTALIALCAAACDEGGGASSSTEPSAQTVSKSAAESVKETAEASTAAPSGKFDKALLKKDENGFYTYSDGGIDSLIGVDVSSYSGEVDWNGLSSKGVSFAIIRIGGRGYGDSGALYTDESYDINLSGASAAGIETGVYFFSQATSVREAEEEADYVLNLIEGKGVSYVAYDFERIKDDDARTDDVPDSDIPAFARAYCAKVSEAGYNPLIYYDTENNPVYDDVDDIPLWVADFNGVPEIDERVAVWQYKKVSDNPDAVGSIDYNIMFIRE